MSAVRHLASTKALVVDLYEGGWRPAEIERILRREGIPVPSRNTMWVWTHPKKASRQQQRDLASSRRWRVEQASFAWPGVRGPEWKLERMRVLQAAGLSHRAIAATMSVDFPNDPPLTSGQVRYAVSTRPVVTAGAC